MRWARRFDGDISMINKLICIILLCMILSFSFLLVGCNAEDTKEGMSQAESKTAVSGQEKTEAGKKTEEGEEDTQLNHETKEDEQDMKMFIDGTEVEVAWEDNESVDALRELGAKGLDIPMSMYGGFEQVGRIGQDIPADNEQITTEAGDIVLYSGNQLVVFYGSNSWAYTRLGHITGKTAEELEDLLGNGDVTITISSV